MYIANPGPMPKFKLEVGDFVLYATRLVEVVSFNGALQPIVKFIDEGGVSWTFVVNNDHNLKQLTNPGETTLDAISRATKPPHSKDRIRVLERLAEQWLGAPEIGDVFKTDALNLEMWIEVRGFQDERINCVYYSRHSGGTWDAKGYSFPDLTYFRKLLSHGIRPGYRVSAFCTSRPYCDDAHRHLVPSQWLRERSPLFTGEFRRI